MKKMISNYRLFTMALMTGMVLFTSCEKDEATQEDTVKDEIENGATLPKTITEDITLTKNNS